MSSLCEATDKKRMHSEEAVEGNEVKRAKAAANASSLIDTSLLFHCSSCNKLLLSAIFHCRNGHASCSECSSKVNEKCSACSSSLDSCPGQEVIIEVFNVSCPYCILGCKVVTLPYTELQTHKEFCIYAPRLCPVPGCTFEGPICKLSFHIRSNHSFVYKLCARSSGSKFSMTCMLSPFNDPVRVLQDNHGGPLFLLLNARDRPSGNSLSIISLGPGYYKYRIKVRYLFALGDKRRFMLEAPVENIRERREGYNHNGTFLFVPDDFFKFGVHMVDVAIKKTEKPLE